MLKNLKNKKKKGFTLIELIIVIAIIAILAAVAVPKFGDVRRNAALKSDIANAKVIADATSALIADGSIEVKQDSTSITTTNVGDTTLEGKIRKYLQNTPTPKTAGYSNYKVYITNEGNVSISMIATGTSTDTPGKSEYNLYPNASTTTPQ